MTVKTLEGSLAPEIENVLPGPFWITCMAGFVPMPPIEGNVSAFWATSCPLM